MVECTQGGYSGRFDHGKNPKANFETRTHTSQWLPDTSVYRSNILMEDALSCPTLSALAIQEIEGRQLRDAYRKKVKPIKYNKETETRDRHNNVLRRRGFYIPYF